MPGFNLRKHLKAYVKYGLHNGQKIVPGSLIFRESPPRDPGIWKEVDTVKCCPKGGPCSSGGYWVNLIINENEIGSYPVSTAIDSNCNIYSFQEIIPSFYTDPDKIQIIKFNSKGDVVWDVGYQVSTSISSNWQYISVSPNDENLVVVNQEGIYVLNTSNGSIKWDRFWGHPLQYLEVVGTTFDSDGNIIILGLDFEEYYYIGKIDIQTGVTLNQKKISYLIQSGFGEIYSPPFLDKEGNIYIGGTYYFPYVPYDGLSGPHVTKLDANFNFVWSTFLNSPLDSYTNITSFTADGLGNSYVVGLDGGSLGKFDSNGDIQWNVTCVDSVIAQDMYLYCCTSSPEGDVFWVYTYQNDWDGQGNIDELIIVKFNTLGQKQSATGISYAPGGIKQQFNIGGWNFTNAPMDYKNGTISIPCNTPYPYDKNFLIKFSADNNVFGVFGDYIYRDVSSFINVTNSAYTKLSMTAEITDTLAFSDANEIFVSDIPATIDLTVTNTKT
jgi:hypothetical protein